MWAAKSRAVGTHGGWRQGRAEGASDRSWAAEPFTRHRKLPGKSSWKALLEVLDVCALAKEKELLLWP